MDLDSTIPDQICTRCKQTYPLTVQYWGKSKRNRDGFLSQCKKCRVDYDRQWRKANPDLARERKMASQRRSRQRVLEHYSQGTACCACCGEARYEFLALDHIEGGGWRHRREMGQEKKQWRWAQANGYPPLFRVLCHNCNMARGFWGECPHERERRERGE